MVFFNQPRLAVLDMQWSKLVQVWEGSKSLQKLKIINLSYSRSLIKSPDFSELPNLEELILEGYESLSEIHPSIGHLKRLSLVNLRKCCSLISLPRDFYKSKSVEILHLNFCDKLRELHEDLGEMISLRILEVDSTSIRHIPSAILRLKNLTRLFLTNVKKICLPDLLHGSNSLRDVDLAWCSLLNEIRKDLWSLSSLQYLYLRENDFHTLPNLNGLSKLEILWLTACKNLHTILGLPASLRSLYAVDCPALETMPDFSEMSNMRKLNISDSLKLTEVPGLDKSLNSVARIDMQGCTNLTVDFKKNILQGWTSCGFGGIFLPGNYVPDWFEFVNDGNKVSFDIPLNNGRNFEGLTLLCSYSCNISVHPPTVVITVINNTKRTELRTSIIKEHRNRIFYKPESHHIWQGQLSNDKLSMQGGNRVEVDINLVGSYTLTFASFTLNRIGVNLEWDKPMKENVRNLDKAGYVFDPHPARFYGEAQSRW